MYQNLQHKMKKDPIRITLSGSHIPMSLPLEKKYDFNQDSIISVVKKILKQKN